MNSFGLFGVTRLDFVRVPITISTRKYSYDCRLRENKRIATRKKWGTTIVF